MSDHAPHGKPPLLPDLIHRWRRQTVILVAAVGLAPNFADAPFVTRYEVWGAIVILAVGLVTASHTSSRAVLGVVLAVAGFAFAGAELRFRVAGGDRDPHAVADPPKPPPARPPRARVTELAPDPIATIRAFQRRWVLHADGLIEGLDARGKQQLRFRVTAPAAALVPCAGALIVTHGKGHVARIDPTTGTVRDYPYSDTPGDAACGGGFVWASKPDAGSVVQLRPRSLRYVDEYPVVDTVTSIAFQAGAVWLLDGPANEVVGVNLDKERLGPFPVMPDARQVIAGGGYLFVLHREQSCLRRLDTLRGRETGAGVALGPYPWRLHYRDGVVYVSDYVDGSILAVGADSLRPRGRPVVAAGHAKLVDADEYAGDLIGLDTAEDRLLTLGPKARVALRAGRPPRRDERC
jgi:hypothetical protein